MPSVTQKVEWPKVRMLHVRSKCVSDPKKKEGKKKNICPLPLKLNYFYVLYVQKYNHCIFLDSCARFSVHSKCGRSLCPTLYKLQN